MAHAPLSLPDPVHRTIDVEAAPDDVWRLIVDDDERARWFGGPTTLEPRPGGSGSFVEPDGTRRSARVDEVVPGRRLSWTWAPADRDDPAGGATDEDDGAASRVEIDLSPCHGGTRITVTETPVAPGMTMSALARPLGPLVDLELGLLLRAGAALHCRA